MADDGPWLVSRRICVAGFRTFDRGTSSDISRGNRAAAAAAEVAAAATIGRWHGGDS